jgi:indole-3-glycerol phosphate synthase
MSVLTEILARKRQRLAEAKANVPVESLRERIKPGSHRFLTTLQRDAVNVIAEFKRRSPSKGIIRADVAAPSMARCYEAGGAAAISVLTEEDYFAGSLDDLRTVKSVVAVPVLRKDFVFDDYQIYESAAAGADAVLLIVAALDDEQLSRLRQLAEDDLGLDALVEVHDSGEMNRATAAGAKLVGVNNRNLHTFDVSLQTSVTLADIAPKGATLISESGLRNAEDLAMLRGVGYQGFLIGETLMRAERPDEVLRTLL